MKHLIFFIFALITAISGSIAYANCDLTRYRWECELTIQKKPTASAHSLVFCGDVYGYVTTTEYDILARYHRANVNMGMTINDSYFTGPCIPAGR